MVSALRRFMDGKRRGRGVSFVCVDSFALMRPSIVCRLASSKRLRNRAIFSLDCSTGSSRPALNNGDRSLDLLPFYFRLFSSCCLLPSFVADFVCHLFSANCVASIPCAVALRALRRPGSNRPFHSQLISNANRIISIAILSRCQFRALRQLMTVCVSQVVK